LIELKHWVLIWYGLIFTDENPKEVKDIVKMHRDLLNNGSGALDSYKQLIDKIKSRGFTKGHFQGVSSKVGSFPVK